MADDDDVVCQEYGFGDEDDDTTLVPMEPGTEVEVPPIDFEYLDHPADVQIHARGPSLETAFEQCAMGMFNYMSGNYDQVRQKFYVDIAAQAHDEESLLYQFLDELLYRFSTEPFMYPRVVKITDYDGENFAIKARCYGEEFDTYKFQQGTEVKAVTYSNMQIHHLEDGACEVFVIVDI